MELFVLLDNVTPSQGFVTSFTNATPLQSPPVLTRSDVWPLDLYFLYRNSIPTPGRPFVFADPTGWANVVFAAGYIDTPPTDGTFKLLDESTAFPTAAIAFNASASAVQSALQAVMGSAWNTATVTGNNGGPWLVRRGTNGATDGLIGDSLGLIPAGSTVQITVYQEGTADIPMIVQVRLLKALPVLNASWTPVPAGTPSSTVIQNGSSMDPKANKIFEIDWNNKAIGGGVSFTFDGGTNTGTIGPIPYNATADQVASLFALHPDVGTNGVSVIQNAIGQYTITCIGNTIKNSDTPTLDYESDTLVIPPGLRGVVNNSTVAFDDILGTNTSVDDVIMSVEVTKDSGQPATIVQVGSCIFQKDLIGNNPGSGPSGNINYLTENSGTNFYPLVEDTTDLKAIVTENKSVPLLAFYVDSGVVTLKGYRLRAGTDAESLPGIVRPNDYNGATNAKVWEQVL